MDKPSVLRIVAFAPFSVQVDNQLQLGSMYPSNRYEVKLGINVDVRKRWTSWANVAGAWGRQSFHQYALRMELKYT